MTPERSELARFFGNRANGAWVEAFARLARELGAHYKMNRTDWCAFLGQIGHETDGLSLANMRENMHYRAARIREVFAFRLTKALKKDATLRAEYRTTTRLSEALAGNPKMLADVVYGGREGTPWMEGSRYIGRGPTQITHHDNYAAICEEIRKQPGGAGCPDLVTKPETLEIPDWGVRSAFADWKIKGLSHYVGSLTDADIERLSAVINTGSVNGINIVNGMASRKRWTAKALAVWPATTDRDLVEAVIYREGSYGPEVAEIQKRLRELGYAVGAEDGRFGILTARAVRAFQAEHELKIDGEVGPRTLDCLRASAPADLGARQEITVKELEKRGSVPVRAARRLGVVARVLQFLGLGGAGTEVAFPGTLSGLVDTMSAAKTQAVAVHEIFGWLFTPIGGIALAGLLCVGVGMLIMRWSQRSINASVAAAQSGHDLSV